MSSYRFCRTDDIGLLVEALNRCWAPYFPGEPPETPATFKRSIRDLQVWCSSCMVTKAVEESCRKNGIDRVTVAELERIRSRMPTPKMFG